MSIHSKQTGNSAIHPAMYVGSSDPASPDTSVTADNKLWIDTTTGTTLLNGWLLKIRASSNTVWTTILDLATALALKANLASPTFTGTPAAPTAVTTTNTTQLATTAFVQQEIAAGTAVVADNSISNAKLRDSTALTVIGRSANSTGDPADIAAGSDGDVLRRSGTALGFGTIAASALGSGQVALARGGTNADLSATGGAKQFLKQSSSGAAVTVGTITELDVGASTNDAGNTSTAITVDWSVARTQKVTATGSATVTHSNMVAGIVYTLEYYTGAGSFTATFASTNFAGGTAPTLTVTASKVDVFTFYKTIGGTIFGGVFGQSFAP